MAATDISIWSDGKRIESSLDLVSVDVIKEVNRIPTAQLIVVDGLKTEAEFPVSSSSVFKPGSKIEIKLGHQGEAPAVTVFQGVVVRHGIEATGNDALLTVEMKDVTVRLTRGRKSAVYAGKTDTDIIRQILQAKALRTGRLPKTQPAHREIIQYHCTDWDFMLSRAASQGLLVTVDDGIVSLREPSLSGPPKCTFTFGESVIFDFAMEVDGSHQHARVESLGWDIKNKATRIGKATAVNLSPGNLKGDAIAKAIGFADDTQSSVVPLEPEELKAWADATMMRSRLSLIHGRVGVPGVGDLKPMDVVKLAGMGDRFNGSALVTGVRHRVDQHGWQTDVQIGLAAETLSAHSDIVDVPAAGLLPAVSGLQIGLVQNFTDDPAKELRVRVQLPGVDQKDPVWARLALPDAGKDRGYFFQPEVGDEVVVGFLNNDPRQAVILGALYGSKNAPKEFKQTKDNFEKGIATKKGIVLKFVDKDKASMFIETPKKNKILLDDEAEKVEVADQHGNKVTMSKDGIVIKSAKDVKIDAAGNVEIKGQKVDVK
jgi:uncharacterized protein involved in type VI secretion and phage assembly